MVKIINGEIVQDNDPRLRNIQKPSSSNPASSRRDDMSSLRGRGQSQSASNQQHGGRQPPAATSNPLEGVANALGISDKFITIPAIPPFGLSATRVGWVYFILVGVLYMVFGYRALLFAVVAYGMYKHQGEQQ